MSERDRAVDELARTVLANTVAIVGEFARLTMQLDGFGRAITAAWRDLGDTIRALDKTVADAVGLWRAAGTRTEGGHDE